MVPVAVEVWRGGRVESRHRASLAVVDRRGRITLAVGDVEVPVYPRSAIKPLQAIPLVESGAADSFGLGEVELALACSSHGGEPRHVARVEAWLRRLGLSEPALACGPHPPSHTTSAEELWARGGRPSQLHNNCSGKHAAMLTLARQLGAAEAGYARADHPVQQAIREVLVDLTDGALSEPPAIDGCGVPTWAMPLPALALAFARFASPDDLPVPRAAACRRIALAMRREPWFVAGSGRLCSALLACGGGVLGKTGAEGVFVAADPARGLGLALKVEDGAGRAAEVALLAALSRLGWLARPALDELERFARPVLRNWAGTEVGQILPAPGWLADAG